MFKTHMGPVEDSGHTAYLRPETAQGMFVDFQTVQQTSRKKIPFGIAQQGKSFRNEITPGNFVFRTREFEQMEMEYFVKPGTDEEWHDYWLKERMNWFTGLGMQEENVRLREHDADELSHYAKRTYDIEYNFPGMGWSELEGIANRTDFDLKAHSAASGEDLSYFDHETEERYVPYVIEPAVGVERRTLRLPHRRLPRGRGADRRREGRETDLAEDRQAPGPHQGRGAAVVETRRPRPGCRQGGRRGPAATS